MVKLPSKLKHDTILEAIFELRFEPAPPNEAVFGVIYPVIMKKFQGLKHIALPISQLPDAVRNSDIQFKYQPINRLQGEGLSISIGPRVINFSIVKPYIGWSKWKPDIMEILHNLSDNHVIKNVERTGLRYLDFIERDVFPLIKAKIEIIDSSVKPASTSVRAEVIEEEYIKVLQLANNVSINEKGQEKHGSLYNHDYLRNMPLFSFRHDQIKIGMDIDENEDIDEDDFPEIEMVEIPVVKRMVFQFKEPVDMEFS